MSKDTAEKKPETKPAAYAWNTKYEACTECKGTERKHYSGGLCTHCYTQQRNARLKLHTYNPETQARKLEKLDVRIQRMEAELKKLKAQRKELTVRVA